MAVSMEGIEVTSRGSLRMLGVSGRSEREAGFRAVATMRLVVWVAR